MKKFILLSVFGMLLSVASYAIAPILGSTSTCVGWSVTLSDATTGGTWSCSNPAIASVGATTGAVTGVATGTATITYTAGGSYVTVSFTVNPTDAISGGTTVCVGGTMTLTGTPAGGSWTSGTPGLATVSSTGVVTGVSTGSIVNIYYTAGGCYAYQMVTVAAALPAVTGTTTVAVGGTSTLSDATTGGAWSTSNPAIATVGASTGTVTGVSAGNCNITYSAGSCSVYVLFTVTAPISSITGGSSVCSGSSITLHDATTGGVWSSSNPAVASITSGGVVNGVAAGACTITYTVGTAYVTEPFTVYTTPAPITGSSSVTAGSACTLSDLTCCGTWTSSNTAIATISSGGSVYGVAAGSCTITYTAGSCSVYFPFSVTALVISPITGYSSGCIVTPVSLSDATPGGTWSCSNPSLASVSSTGVVTGIAAGSVTITYAVGSGYVTMPFTVNPLPVITGGSTLCAGSSLTLTGTPAGGSWTSGGPALASVSSGGVVTALSAGVVNIYYTNGCAAFHSVTVNPVPATITGTSVLCTGSSYTFTASAPGGAWSSDATGIAGVDPATGVVTAVSPGAAHIQYWLGGCAASYTVTVNTAAAISGSSTVCIGSSITLTGTPGGGAWTTCGCAHATVSSTGLVTGVSAGVETITYTSGGCYAVSALTVDAPPAGITGSSSVTAGGTCTLSDATAGGAWSSSNPSVAAISSAGLVSGVATGSCTITYSLGACAVYYSFTVTSFTIAPITGYSGGCIGTPVTLADATPGGIWSCSNPSLASVSTSGVVTGIAAGTVTITYTVGAGFVTTSFTVDPIPVISGGTGTLCLGSAMTLSGTPSGGTWTSGSPTLASVSPGGVVTALSPGVVNIYYTNGCYTFMPVTVSATPATISGASLLCMGSSYTFTASAPGGTWSSDATSIATVNPTTGMVTAVSAGVVHILYSLGGCSGSYTLTVYSAPTITGSSTVCTGSTITLTGGPSGGTWTSCACSYAAVSSAGVVSGVSAGVETITYTTGSCYATYDVTVYATPVIYGGSTSICVGGTLPLTASVPGGAWTSCGCGHATVNSSGLVTGVSAGTETITYTNGTCFAVTSVTVAPLSATISGTPALCVGAAFTFTASAPGGTWVSDNTAVATVDPATGIVTALAAGVVHIQYWLGGCGPTYTLNVTAAAPFISGSTSVCAGSSVTLSGSPSGGTWSACGCGHATISPTGFVTGTSAGVETITYSSGGCYALYTVTVDPAPVISWPSSSHILTMADLFTLTADIPGGTWSSSNTGVATIASTGTVSPVAPGYTYISYTVGSCAGLDTLVVSAHPHALPSSSISGTVSSDTGAGMHPVVGMAVTLVDPASSITVGSSVTDGSGAYSFTGLPEGSYIVYPSQTGYSTISSTASLSPAVPVATINFIKDKTGLVIRPVVSGVSIVSSIKSMRVYPNPTSGVLGIYWENQNEGTADVFVTDIAGRIVFRSVMEINAPSGNKRIDLSGMKDGIYIINVRSAETNFTGKIEVTR